MSKVQAPAGSADFETTVSRTALPPMEFAVTGGTSSTSISITDRSTPNGRTHAASYRVYFLPDASLPVGTMAQRTAATRMASFVADIPAPGKGTVLQWTDTRFAGQSGHYFCVSVNQRGAESPVEHVVTV